MKKSIFVITTFLLGALVSCQKEDTSLVVDFNHSYRTLGPSSMEALVVPFVLHSSNIGSSGIYIGTDSLYPSLSGAKIPSNVTGTESFSIVVDTLNPGLTYYWQPYLEVNWNEYRGEILSF